MSVYPVDAGEPELDGLRLEVPDLNAQLYRTSIDAERTLWTDDAGQAVLSGRAGVLIPQ